MEKDRQVFVPERCINHQCSSMIPYWLMPSDLCGGCELGYRYPLVSHEYQPQIEHSPGKVTETQTESRNLKHHELQGRAVNFRYESKYIYIYILSLTIWHNGYSLVLFRWQVHLWLRIPSFQGRTHVLRRELRAEPSQVGELRPLAEPRTCWFRRVVDKLHRWLW